MLLQQSLDTVLQRGVQPGGVPGVVAMVTNREGTLYEGAFGVRKIGTDLKMTKDSVVLIASMTKALTTVAALQLVEQGKLDLDSPASKWLPDLGKVQVLEGFDADGKPKLRAPKRAVTLKHLLTHTAGFSYQFFNENLQKWQAATGAPGFTSSAYASLMMPLMFDPGERWEYGVNTDWAGLLVEKASGQKLNDYLLEHVLKPLGMTSTSMKISPDMRNRLAVIHARLPDGGLAPLDLEIPQDAEVDMGGHALYGTCGDYLKFVRMMLNGGQGEKGRVLKAETVEAMSKNQLEGGMEVPSITSADLSLSNHFPLPPDNPHFWSLAFLINSKPLPTGRKAGSLMWAGLANSYYWIDPTSGIGGVYLSQILPFGDIKSLPLFFEFEATAYQALAA
jgi:methyl acetate hydrolase